MRATPQLARIPAWAARKGSRRINPRLLLLAALPAALAPEGVGAQSRETLETRVTVRGDQVFLEWSAKHPWDAMLFSSAPTLLAEYRTRGTVALDCLQGSASAPRRAPSGCAGVMGTRERGARERSLTYRLPASLTATPEGAVCLLFRMPNQRLLPIRRVGNQQAETARFHYPEWESVARRAVASSSTSRRLEEVRQVLEAKRRELASQEESSARRGWTSSEACRALPAPELEEADAEARPLAGAGEREAFARTVCIMRIRNAAQATARRPLTERIALRVALPPSVLDSVMARVRGPRGGAPLLAREREAQLAEFRRDWATFSPHVVRYATSLRDSGYRAPHFGTFDDYLALQTYTQGVGGIVGKELAGGRAPEREMVAGYVGGNVEAYQRCVADGRAQMQLAAETAAELAQRRPLLQESARQSFVKSCEDATANAAALRAEIARMEVQVAELQSAPAGSPEDTRLPERARDANDAICVP